jgi:hypothetical protein
VAGRDGGRATASSIPARQIEAVGGGLLGGGLFDCLHGEAVAAHVSQGSGDGRNAGGNRLAAMREGMRVLCWKQLSFAMIFPSLLCAEAML